MAQTIRDVMSTNVRVLTSDKSIAQAAELMRDEGIGAVPVANNDKLVGMVTDRDIVIRAVAEHKDLDHTRVGEIVSPQVLYCFDDDSTESVAANMRDNQIRRLPVVDHDKQLVGIVSLGDLSAKGPADAAGSALEGISQAESIRLSLER